ncbi:MAG: glycosyltransferase family 4 protein [bacterium]
MRITCFISSLSCGGAQRSMITLTDQLRRRGHEVILLTHANSAADFFDIPEGLRRLTVHPDASADCRWFDLFKQKKRKRALQKSIIDTHPDVVISFLTESNIRILLALAGCRIPVVVCERTDPRLCPLDWRWRVLRRIMYPKASAVVVQSEDLLEWTRSLWPRWKSKAIPNPVLRPAIDGELSLPPFFKKAHRIVSVGRLAEEKRFDHLLDAFAGISSSFPDWQLTILGEGPLRGVLEQEVQDLQVGDRVQMPGICNQLQDVLRAADLFVLSSRFEGFPNALAEALAHGVPGISYDSCPGPREIIRHNLDGILVPDGDVDELGRSMATLMANEKLRAQYGTRARDIAGRFAIDDIVDRWEQLIREVAAEEGD